MLEVLGCGHFYVLTQGDIEIVRRDTLYAKIKNDPAELRFRELLDAEPNIQVARPKNLGRCESIQKFFFVDGTTFEHCIATGKALLMRPDEQASLLLLSPLPQKTSELGPELDRFWDRWV